MINGILNCNFPVVEWSTDTKTGYDDLEVYMVYGYASVSTTGWNHAKMAYSPFKHIIFMLFRPSRNTDGLFLLRTCFSNLANFVNQLQQILIFYA